MRKSKRSPRGQCRPPDRQHEPSEQISDSDDGRLPLVPAVKGTRRNGPRMLQLEVLPAFTPEGVHGIEHCSRPHLSVDISEGKGTEDTLGLIEALADTVEAGSLCALGTTAVNPVRSTLKFFRAEYEAHVVDHKCPAGVCKELIHYEITDNCTGCLLCKKRCPESCITGEKKKLHLIDQEKCIKCGICLDVCKDDAVLVS